MSASPLLLRSGHILVGQPLPGGRVVSLGYCDTDPGHGLYFFRDAAGHLAAMHAHQTCIARLCRIFAVSEQGLARLFRCRGFDWEVNMAATLMCSAFRAGMVSCREIGFDVVTGSFDVSATRGISHARA